MPYPTDVHEKLVRIYEDLMWLCARPHVTPPRARAWYSAVWSEALKAQVRIFSGQVSSAALEDVRGRLCLEHYKRLSASLSALLARHVQERLHDPDDFVRLIEACERVNITTAEENRLVEAAQGDYEAAGIRLVEWASIGHADRAALWQGWLRGKVANARAYAPEPSMSAGRISEALEPSS